MQVTVASLADAERLAPAFPQAGYTVSPTGGTTGRPATQATWVVGEAPVADPSCRLAAREPLPATYSVRGAFRLSWASDSANLVTHSLQMKISVSLAKSWGSLTGYSAPKSVCTCW